MPSNKTISGRKYNQFFNLLFIFRVSNKKKLKIRTPSSDKKLIISIKKNERASKLIASESFFGSTIEISYLTEAITAIAETIDINKAKTPKSSGVYNRDNIGEIKMEIT
jgi:hypothetical protein